MHLLLHDPILTISYDHLSDWLVADWGTDQSQESVQWGCQQMLRLLKAEHARKVLNDNRRVQTLWADASEWVGRVWFPQMADAGLEYFAWVYSPHLYSRLSTDRSLDYLVRPIVMTFNNVETARNWLRAM